jgi:diamine N-acetyltransferase
VLALKVAEPQLRYIASNARTLAQAADAPEAWLRAIYAGPTPVGLLLLHDEHLREPPRETGYYFLWRLMIDAAHQGNGYGRQAVDLLINHVATRPCVARLLSSYISGADGPEQFYRRYGFTPTGNLIGEEIEIAIPIKSAKAGCTSTNDDSTGGRHRT